MNDSTDLLFDRISAFLTRIPDSVMVLAAAKQRSVSEIQTAINAGIIHVGHNYVQEGQAMVSALGKQATWHMIGHLQRNKARAAMGVFDMLQTLDSIKLASIIQEQCEQLSIVYPVLVEVNSAREPQKSGVMPENLDEFLYQLADLNRISVEGLLSMGPLVDDPEKIRPYFRLTRQIFDRLSASHLPNVRMKYLSMGMSSSYQAAIQEGANMIRIGTALFGERPAKAIA